MGLKVFKGFLYLDQIRKYLTKDKSAVSEEQHAKNDDEIDESHKSQLQFEHDVY